MKKLLFLIPGSLLFLVPAISTALASQCDEMTKMRVTTWSQNGRVMPYVVAMLNGHFKAHCIDFEPVIAEAVPAMTDQFKDDETLDASMTFEPAASIMKDHSEGRWDGETPQLLGSFAGNHFVIAGRKPVRELVGEILVTERCPDTDEHEDGTVWRDVTDPATETYIVTQPSLNTVMKMRMLRNAIGRSLPDNTRIICGTGFSEGVKPDTRGTPAVFIEEGHKSRRRGELLVEGKVSAASLFAEHYYNIRNLADLVIYEDVIGASSIPATGLFAYPSRVAEKKDAFCRMNVALSEATNSLLAGNATFTENGVDMDDAARSAFKIFEAAVEYDGVANPLQGALTIKEQTGTDIDQEATRKVREEFFVRMRNNVWRSSQTPTQEQIDMFFEWFKLEPEMKTTFYVDPCS